MIRKIGYKNAKIARGNHFRGRFVGLRGAVRDRRRGLLEKVLVRGGKQTVLKAVGLFFIKIFSARRDRFYFLIKHKGKGKEYDSLPFPLDSESAISLILLLRFVFESFAVRRKDRIFQCFACLCV